MLLQTTTTDSTSAMCRQSPVAVRQDGSGRGVSVRATSPDGRNRPEPIPAYFTEAIEIPEPPDNRHDESRDTSRTTHLSTAR
jgi:hypothetical protein